MTSESAAIHTIIIRAGDLLMYDGRLKLISLEDLSFFKHHDDDIDGPRWYMSDVYDVNEERVFTLHLWNDTNIEVLQECEL